MSSRKRGHGEQAAVPLRRPGLDKVPVRTGHPQRACQQGDPLLGPALAASTLQGSRLRECGEALTHPSLTAFVPPSPDLRGSARVCWAHIRSPLGPIQRHRVTTRRRPVPAGRCHRPTNHWSHRGGTAGVARADPFAGRVRATPRKPAAARGPGHGGQGGQSSQEPAGQAPVASLGHGVKRYPTEEPPEVFSCCINTRTFYLRHLEMGYCHLQEDIHKCKAF